MIIYKEKSSVYGKLMLLEGIILLIPLGILPFYLEEIKYTKGFLIPSILSCLLGIIICSISEKKKKTKEENGAIVVLFAWGYGIFLGAMPFFLNHELGFVQSIFESISGFTTTGLSVMNVESTARIFLFYRGFIQFVGGLGFILMMILFIEEKQAMDLYYAEGHPDKLMPNLGKTVKIIFAIYSGFLAIGTIAYMLCKMPFFDAIIHAMCALSTGGFSTKTDSIGAYQSISIEFVTIILMLIGTTNFAVLLLLVKGKIKQFFQVSEIRFMGIVLAVFIPILAISLFFKTYIGLGESFRMALFNVVSALSTSGFSTSSYTDWSEFSVGIMILLMLIGGGIGSTAGGIKLTRVYFFLRNMIKNLAEKIGTKRQIRVMHYYRASGKTYLDNQILEETMGFIGTYMIIFIVGSLGISFFLNCNLSQAMFEFASSLGTVGLSIGLTNPDTITPVLIIEMIGMVLGRLEVFTIFIGVYEIVKKIKKRQKKYKK